MNANINNPRAMTDEEKKQFTHMQSDIEQIKIRMTNLGTQMDKMYFALMGNEIAQDGGLVRRIIDLEDGQAEIKTQLQKIENKVNKSSWHVNVMWGAAGAVLMALFSLFLSYMFKK